MSLFDGRKKELKDEIESHLRMATADRVAAGATPEDARREAMREFGNVPLVTDVTRERWGWLRMESLVRDVRFALRQLWKTPGFTLTAVLTLALGIGANTAIFTLVHAILLKNLPVVDPKALVRVGNHEDCCYMNEASSSQDDSYSIFPYETYKYLHDHTPEFEQLAAMEGGMADLSARRTTGDATSHSSFGEFVSGNYFETFGVPQLNRKELVSLARIGALNSFADAEHRRDALWQVEQAARPVEPLLRSSLADSAADLRKSPLRAMTTDERIIADYSGTGLTTGPHPMAYRRAELRETGILAEADLAGVHHHKTVRVAGAVIARQRPGTAKGFVFLSLEDETGISNIIITPDVFEWERIVVTRSRFLQITGPVQNQDGVAHVKAQEIAPLEITQAAIGSRDFH